MIAGEFIPADGEVVEGVATVDESAITGESAPVIREAGGDRSAVTAGTRVLSDRIVVKATATQGSTFLDRMIALVEGAARKKTPNEIALTVLLSGLSLIFVLAVATIPAFAAYSGGLVSVVALAALFIALIPTTIGGLLSTIGIDLVAPLSAIGAPAIIVLSALGEEARKVKALDAGADDFVTKPFGVGEFMARVRAALRHRLAMKGSAGAYDDGRLHVDLVRRAVSINGEDPKLTPREFDLLSELVTHAGKVLTHRHLLNSVWRNADAADVEALRVHIRNLRQKVEADPQKPALILTELGVGYRYSAPA